VFTQTGKAFIPSTQNNKTGAFVCYAKEKEEEEEALFNCELCVSVTTFATLNRFQIIQKKKKNMALGLEYL
jgi:hypothetical protein